jgi:hypothetical protein
MILCGRCVYVTRRASATSVTAAMQSWGHYLSGEALLFSGTLCTGLSSSLPATTTGNVKQQCPAVALDGTPFMCCATCTFVTQVSHAAWVADHPGNAVHAVNNRVLC